MINEVTASSAADRKEIDYTVGTLNATVNAILNELDRSTMEVKFPQPVDFNGDSLDSVSSKAAANTVRQLIRARQLLIAVEPGFTGPLFSVAQYSVIAGNKAGDPRFIGTFFTGNFFARCLADGSEPENIVKKTVSLIVYQDVLMTANKSPRASLPPKETDSLVEVYRGPKLTRR